MKDLFSTQADLYSRYRPTYPADLYQYILSSVKKRRSALDCATGNGQVAASLSEYFDHIDAIDISQRQLDYAVQRRNVTYCVSAAEKTPFDDNSFDLITVAQAYHWLDTHAFCREATRIGRPNAVVAVWAYDLVQASSPIDDLVRHWNFDILGPYWEKERAHVYNHYRDLAFEFDPLPVREFRIQTEWSCEDLIGHLRTWSALQTMMKNVGTGPFDQIVQEITGAWGTEARRPVEFSLFLKLGRIVK